MDSIALRLVREWSLLRSLPSLIGGKYGIGIVDATRIDVWSNPCTSRFATFVRALRSSSDSGTITSPFARSRTLRICASTGPCVSSLELYSETICSTVFIQHAFNFLDAYRLIYTISASNLDAIGVVVVSCL